MKSHRALSIPVLLVFNIFILATEAAAQKPGNLKFEPYVFEAANKQKVDAELGRLLVPENRRKPNSRLIELAVVRFKSTAEKPGPPIVYLAGGPGGSGIAAARSSRFTLFMAMREIGDVIALDQRGTGMSKPNLTCRETLNVPLEKAHLREVVLEEYRKQSRSCANYWREQGVDLAGYNTDESADDLEDLRKALGTEKISLWAISYGTHLSLAAIRRHEKSIHRVILAGVEGPDHTAKLPSNIQNHLVNLDRLVKADSELSKDVPDLLGLMKRVLERYEREPVTYEVTDPTTQQKAKVTVNRTVLQALTVQAFGFGDGGIPRAYYTLDKEGAAGSAQLWARAMRPQANFGSAMSAMMDCYSGMSPERKRQIEREAKTTLLGDVMDFPFPYICDAWGSPDLGASFRGAVKSRVPVLFISGTLDVRTPPSNAEEVRKGFPNSEHLIIEGAVHSDPLFLSSPKIKDVMLEFMKGQKISTTRIALPPMKFAPVKKE